MQRRTNGLQLWLCSRLTGMRFTQNARPVTWTQHTIIVTNIIISFAKTTVILSLCAARRFPPRRRQHRRQPSTYATPGPNQQVQHQPRLNKSCHSRNVVLVEGVPIEEVEEAVNRVPLNRRLPDDYPNVLEQIGATQRRWH